jgi:hypothetical protein
MRVHSYGWRVGQSQRYARPSTISTTSRVDVLTCSLSLYTVACDTCCNEGQGKCGASAANNIALVPDGPDVSEPIPTDCTNGPVYVMFKHTYDCEEVIPT